MWPLVSCLYTRRCPYTPELVWPALIGFSGLWVKTRSGYKVTWDMKNSKRQMVTGSTNSRGLGRTETEDFLLRIAI